MKFAIISYYYLLFILVEPDFPISQLTDEIELKEEPMSDNEQIHDEEEQIHDEEEEPLRDDEELIHDDEDEPISGDF